MGLFKLFAGFAALVAAEEVQKKTADATITEHVYFQVQIGKNSKTLHTIVFGLFGEEVPKTAENFSMWCQGWSVEDQAVKKIADGGQGYEGSVFHRVIPDFMCQGGDFTNHNGTGGRGIKEEKWADENFNLKHDDSMLLSMANAGPNTNGSQFFITTAMTSWLDGKHVVFGKVVDADSVATVKKMEKQGSGSGKTKKTISIKHSGVAVKDGDDWKCKDRDVVLKPSEKKEGDAPKEDL